MKFIRPVRRLSFLGMYSSIRLYGSQLQQSQFARHINVWTIFGWMNFFGWFRKIQQFLDFPETFLGFSFQVELKVLFKYLVLAKLSTMSICKHAFNHGVDTRPREKVHSLHSIYIKNISFSVDSGGCGDNHKVRMEILVNGSAVVLRSGSCKSQMQRTKVDLQNWVGRIARVKLVDQSVGNWGYITFDDLRYETTCEGNFQHHQTVT